MTVALLGLRGVQFVFAAVVFGICIHMSQDEQTLNDKAGATKAVPVLVGYSAAVGGLGILVALAGAVALFVDSISDVITFVLNGFMTLAFLAGGLGDAIGIGSVDCHKWTSVCKNGISNPLGNLKSGGNALCDPGNEDTSEFHTFTSRCVSFNANTAFMFFGALVCGVLVVLTRTRRSR